LLLSQSVRKPAEIEKTMDVPVFLTIPKLDGVSAARVNRAPIAEIAATSSAGREDEGNDANNSAMAVVSHDGNDAEVAPWEEHHSIHP